MEILHSAVTALLPCRTSPMCLLAERQVLDLFALFLGYGCEESLYSLARTCQTSAEQWSALLCQLPDTALVLPLHRGCGCSRCWVLLLLPPSSQGEGGNDSVSHLDFSCREMAYFPFLQINYRLMEQLRISIYLEGWSRKYMFNFKNPFLFSSLRSQAAPYRHLNALLT